MDNKKSSVFKSRNFKYGSFAMAFTVIVVAAVIITNVIITSLASSKNWYTDMTATRLYSVSDKFTETMESLLEGTDGDVYINIVTLMDEDVFAKYNWQTILLYKTIKQVTEKFDNIKLVSKNILTKPDLAKAYMLTPFDFPSTTDIVIELADANHNPISGSYDNTKKRYSIESFFIIESDSNTYYGYNAESKFLSATAQILNKTEKPVAYYLQGHGEPTLSEATDWQEVLEAAGYEVKAIDLKSEDFAVPENGSCNSDIIVINAPKFDLLSPTVENPSLVSEVRKIRNFLNTNKGNMIVAEDASTPSLPALEELLSEWGLGYGGSITDSAHSVSSSGAAKPMADYALTTSYYTDSDGNTLPPAQILKKVIGTTSNPPKTIFSLPKAVLVYDDSTIVKAVNSSASSFAFLFPYKTATVSGTYSSDTLISMMAFSMIQWDLNDENSTTSYVVALGSTDFLSSDYAISCANRSLMYAMLELTARNVVAFEGIDFKTFSSGALTVTTAQANTWTIICVAAIPAAIIGVGLYVWIRRRHS